MKVLQLGNGGGLDPLQTNSAFLVDLYGDESSYLLFDCGFNIMARLITEEEDKSNNFHISKINYIFLSHVHDDHVGNYETLVYWNFFKNEKEMITFYGNNTVKEYIESKSNYILEAGADKHVDMFYGAKAISEYITHNREDISLNSIKGNHGSIESSGLYIRTENDNQILYISGDTKANPLIEQQVMRFNKTDNKSFKFFHDYSEWNAPTRNVHACEGDFTIEYSKEFQDKCIKYHTGSDEFNKEWQEV